MAAAIFEAKVIELVVEATEVKREDVVPSTRLLHDLGMDGDVAVDFFNRVHEQFGTDLTHLHARWDEHFGPEGLGCASALIILPAAMMGGLVGSAAGPIAGAATTVVLLAATVWAIPRLGLVSQMKPITVADLLSAVEAGRWPPPA